MLVFLLTLVLLCINFTRISQFAYVPCSKLVYDKRHCYYACAGVEIIQSVFEKMSASNVSLDKILKIVLNVLLKLNSNNTQICI